MFHELQHRVANNMQFIASLLSLQSRRLPHGTVGKEVLKDASDRLVTLAAIHRKLHDAHRTNRRFDMLARDVLSDLLRATGCGHVVLRTHADAIALPLDTTTTLILIATEAATNSIKHAFSKARGTTLIVGLARLESGEMELRIADDGPGFPPTEADPADAGMGFKITEALVRRLHGKLFLERGPGALVRVEFPLTEAPGMLDDTSAV
jgi:two-component sensor histidine kinase